MLTLPSIMYIVHEHHFGGKMKQTGVLSRRPGFTLVELLVVVGIIALLVAILIPVLSKARDSAATIKCLSNLRQMGQGIQFYSTEYKGWCTPTYKRDVDPPLMGYWIAVGPTGPYDVPWQQSAASYFVKKYDIQKRGVQVWNCPSGPNPEGVFPSPAGLHGNYGINQDVGGAPLEFFSIVRQNWRIKQLSGVNRPGDKYLLFEAGTYFISQASAKNPSSLRNYLVGYNPLRTPMYNSIFAGEYTRDSILGRHRGRINVVFADGHGETLRPRDVAFNDKGWIDP
jgi:prepilin-type N-terminal cleavage/methylation domain-containing protein/prepilin-type processing-associated H-X9-DG protein